MNPLFFRLIGRETWRAHRRTRWAPLYSVIDVHSVIDGRRRGSIVDANEETVGEFSWIDTPISGCVNHSVYNDWS